MSGILDALHDLQLIEGKLADIRAKADSKRRQVRIHERSMDKQNALMEQKHDTIRTAQMEIDGIELDIKTRDDAINKHRMALNSAKTNKEYTTILTAINTEKADTGKLESRQLQLMTEMDVLRAEQAEIEAEQKKIADRIAFAQGKLDDYNSKTAEDVSRLQAERDKQSALIDPSILSVFNRVAERHEGAALAEVQLLNAKRHEYVCGGCNIAITLDGVLSLQSRDEIQICQSCGMILFLPRELKTH